MYNVNRMELLTATAILSPTCTYCRLLFQHIAFSIDEDLPQPNPSEKFDELLTRYACMLVIDAGAVFVCC